MRASVLRFKCVHTRHCALSASVLHLFTKLPPLGKFLKACAPGTVQCQPRCRFECVCTRHCALPASVLHMFTTLAPLGKGLKVCSTRHCAVPASVLHLFITLAPLGKGFKACTPGTVQSHPRCCTCSQRWRLLGKVSRRVHQALCSASLGAAHVHNAGASWESFECVCTRHCALSASVLHLFTRLPPLGKGLKACAPGTVQSHPRCCTCSQRWRLLGKVSRRVHQALCNASLGAAHVHNAGASWESFECVCTRHCALSASVLHLFTRLPPLGKGLKACAPGTVQSHPRCCTCSQRWRLLGKVSRRVHQALCNASLGAAHVHNAGASWESHCAVPALVLQI
ncbi:hypothetical protein NDU88_007680 [Pleurodeles waltl]|uniref:Uncharacterized protein n=1 Tax=Pleurodeles waltl TaxID=8319 RepID=A0AAV7U1X7_PLEWA|nr:hypothetical protein NDU88_007680 [Pleurodeles waltl]